MSASNSDLVSIIRKSDFYAYSHSPHWDNVVDVFYRVDRRKFLPYDLKTEVPVFDKRKRAAVSALFQAIESRDDSAVRRALDGFLRACQNMEAITVPVRELAYQDEPLPIGHGQTCSQPSIVAFMADQLAVYGSRKLRILGIGSGCGYSDAVALRLAGRGSVLVSAEIIPELAALSARNLSRHFRAKVPVYELSDLAERPDRRIVVVRGDASSGVSALAPFDRIYLAAAAWKGFDSSVLARQLNREGGVVLFPMRDGNGSFQDVLVKNVYSGGQLVKVEHFYGVGFVPLVSGCSTTGG
ncbi:hypothetical protein HY640_00905 [Candidatus Woesearchaeota archaeon]|nr:hypothetical protein [Candidatus Woesearchaeota archaeon]